MSGAMYFESAKQHVFEKPRTIFVAAGRVGILHELIPETK
jgi:hypothetical protein